MKTAAVIVNHNNQDYLNKLVSRIREYDVFDAVVIVDNKSDDVSAVEKIADNVVNANVKNSGSAVNADDTTKATISGKVVLIKADKNGGYGYGNNIGMKWAFGNDFTHAVIANPDIEFSEECVKAMLDEFADEKVAVVAPLCRTPDSNYEAPQSGWNLKTWGQELLSKGPVCRRVFKGIVAEPDIDILKKCAEVGSNAEVAKLADDHNTSATEAIKTVDVDAVLGSFLAVDVAKFQEVGGYDDEVFLYCEENILGQKMKSHGYVTKLLISREYIHNHKPGKPSKTAMKKLTDSELYYFEKYLHASSFQMLVSQLFFDIVYLEAVLAAG